MSDYYAARRVIQEAHELRVRAMLDAYLWHVEPFGQGQLSERMREELRRVDTPLRWIADFIAARNGSVILVDAKGEDPRNEATPNHAIEIASLEAGELQVDMFRLPLYYVWADQTVGTPAVVREHARLGPPPRPGRTPYLLIPKAVMTPVRDSVLGTVLSESAA